MPPRQHKTCGPLLRRRTQGGLIDGVPAGPVGQEQRLHASGPGAEAARPPLGVGRRLRGAECVPPALRYLYPDTPDYYYRYGDGYLYRVDRGTNLIAALLPLLAGGYLPGSICRSLT